MNIKNRLIIVIAVVIAMLLQFAIYNSNSPNYDMTVYPSEDLELQISVDTILDMHDWDNWTQEEQRDLTQMMMYTANGERFPDDLLVGKSDRVLETYIDLIEHAGYK